MLKCFAVRDEKMELFQVPQFYASVVEALRALTVACNDPQSNLNRFSEEYALYELCTLNPTTGEITYPKQPEIITSVSKLIKSNPQNQTK